MGPTGRASIGVHFPSRYRETTMVGARTVPKAGRAGAAGLGAALRDAAAAPEGGVMVIFHSLLPPISYQPVGFARREDDCHRSAPTAHIDPEIPARSFGRGAGAGHPGGGPLGPLRRKSAGLARGCSGWRGTRCSGSARGTVRRDLFIRNPRRPARLSTEPVGALPDAALPAG